METILENITGFVEKIWLRLDILLGLEDMEALGSLQSLLANILSDPLLIGLTLAIITIIPYTIHKIKKAHTEKENRLDALLQELDEEDENDAADLGKPLFQSQTTKTSGFDQPAVEAVEISQEKDPDSEAYGDEFESPSSEKITVLSEDLNQTPQEIFKKRSILDDDFGWESGLDEWNELYDYISKPFQEDKPKEEGESTTVSQKSEKVPQESKTTATSTKDLNQTPQEIFKNRRILDDDFGWESSVEEWDELYDYISKPFQEDKPTAVSSGEEAVSELEKESDEPVPEEEESEEVAEFLEAVSELEKESDEPVPEEKELDPELIEVDETTPPQPMAEVIAPPAVPERIELSLEEVEVEPDLELEPVLQTTTPESPQSEPVATKPSAGPLLKSMLNSSVSAKTDALVSRLKTFQAELETRFHSLETGPETTKGATAAEPLRKKQGDYQPARVSYKSKRKSRSNKEYLRQLESFIFMAKQKNKDADA